MQMAHQLPPPSTASESPSRYLSEDLERVHRSNNMYLRSIVRETTHLRLTKGSDRTPQRTDLRARLSSFQSKLDRLRAQDLRAYFLRSRGQTTTVAPHLRSESPLQ